IFLSSYPTPHRYLHSFPTRRSSDLLLGAQHAASPQSAMPGAALTPQDSALHALNRLAYGPRPGDVPRVAAEGVMRSHAWNVAGRSEEHTSELQSRGHLVCRLLLEKK